MFAEEQFELFPNPVAPSAPSDKIIWSFTRRGALDRCPRQFYYEYYGASKRIANGDSNKERLGFLKKLRNRHLRSGEIAHILIRNYFVKAKQGEDWSLDRLLRWARDLYARDKESSKSYKLNGVLSEEQYPPTILTEFYYEDDDREALWEASEKRLILGLTNFFQKPCFERFKSMGCCDHSIVEKRISYRFGDTVEAQGQVDLAFIDNGLAEIIDWKLGGSASVEESLQLLVYGAWAAKQYSVDTEMIKLYHAHLSEATLSQFDFNKRSLLRVHTKIEQDLERMRKSHVYGVNGTEEAFTPCGQADVCKLCSFQELCPKE